MTKQEAKIVLDAFGADEGAFYEISENDLVTYVNYKLDPTSATPVVRFMMDKDACLGGQSPWFKFKTCESAIRAAHREDDRDALEWFLQAVGQPYVDIVEDGGDIYYSPLRPVKYFLDLIPAKYRTASEKAKKTAKKATNAKRRNRR